jgi:fatty acid desaturase|tara:strand:+ start:4013 stop:5002 length:990 start_codon:yes stop_codon:yes gene_type:complete
MRVDSSIWFTPKIDRKKIKELSKRSNLPGLIHFLVYFASLIFLGYLSYISWGTWFFLIFFFIYSTIYTFAIANTHETVHRTAFKTRWINEVFCYISFFQLHSEPLSFRWSHTFHHSKTLQTEGEYDHEIEVTRPTDLIRFFLKFIPLTDLFYIHQSSFVNITKLAFGIMSASNKITAPKDQQKKITRNARFLLLIWFLIIFVSFYFNTLWLVIFYFLPPFVGRPIHFAVNVTQHLAAKVDTKDHRLSTHTVILNPILSFYYWHMEYHIEHHMFPMVPSYNLKKLRKEIESELPTPFNGLYDFYSKVLPFLIKLAYDSNGYFRVKVPNKN